MSGLFCHKKIFLVLFFYTSLQAHECAYMVCDLLSGAVVAQQGDCVTRRSPCSTFKIALSLMGFDAAILMNEHTPVHTYYDICTTVPEIPAWREPQDPTSWIANSCVWYSRIITRSLGHERFQDYVTVFDYGNCDVSGDTGKNNGLMRAWLCSSLAISPSEQIAFLRKFVQGQLPFSFVACVLTKNLLRLDDLPSGWELYGKTGTGCWDDSHDTIGWFVGWVTKLEQTFVFACVVTSSDAADIVNGRVAKGVMVDVLNKVAL